MSYVTKWSLNSSLLSRSHQTDAKKNLAPSETVKDITHVQSFWFAIGTGLTLHKKNNLNTSCQILKDDIQICFWLGVLFQNRCCTTFKRLMDAPWALGKVDRNPMEKYLVKINLMWCQIAYAHLWASSETMQQREPAGRKPEITDNTLRWCMFVEGILHLPLLISVRHMSLLLWFAEKLTRYLDWDFLSFHPWNKLKEIL